jgi:LPXTG-site transpeptidase (sortase) family protein
MIDRILGKFFNLLIILVGAFLILFGLLSILPSAAASPAPDFPPGFSMDPEEFAAWRAAQESQNQNIPLLLPDPLMEEQPLESAVLEAPVIEVPPVPQVPDVELPVQAQQAAAAPSVSPERLVIDSIGLEAPVVPAISRYITLQGQTLRLWDVPAGFLAGWHPDSVGMGMPGNMVLNGHHNIYGQVFARLIDVQVGEEIRVYGGDHTVRYRVTERYLLPEMNQPLEVRLTNASFIRPTPDNRLTLVTCWPYQTNTHRLIVIATPVEG